MATYAIGDVQGCYDELRRLVDCIDFDPAADTLWFVGDLVNRGPRSLRVLRFVRDLGDAAVTVLGNHDLHLLMLAWGIRRLRSKDTVSDVLKASDRDELIAWLRTRPLVHRHQGHLLVHAGLDPLWTAAEASSLAREIEAELQSDDATRLLRRYRNGHWKSWSATRGNRNRRATALRTLTRIRCTTQSGRLDTDHVAGPDSAPRGSGPWYQAKGRRSRRTTIVFGHWSSLGLRVERNLIALDTGCVWGRALTAIRLEDRQIIQVTPGR